MAVQFKERRRGVAVTALLGALALVVPSAAQAAVNVSLNTAPYAFASSDASGNPIPGDVTPGAGDLVSNNNTPFWTATYSFDLTSAADTLTITDLAADDRIEVELNGDALVGSGIYGPGTGTFLFTPTGSSVPETFLGNYAESQADPLTFSGPFNVGLNTIELIVNNTGNGLHGGLSGGPSSANFTAVVDTPSVSGTPEPESWLLIISGLFAAGAGLRMTRRRGTAAAAAG
jgi:hypothetical protein